MVLYTCPRCRYITTQKGDIRKHFKRKKPCRNLYSNLSQGECLSAVLDEVNQKKTLKTYKRGKKPKNTLKIDQKSEKSPKKAPFLLNFTQNEQKNREKKKIWKKSESKKINLKGISIISNIETEKKIQPAQPYKILEVGLEKQKQKPTRLKKVFICKKCKNPFSRKYNCSRHELICKPKSEVAEAPSEEFVSRSPINSIIKQQSEIIDTLKTQVEMLLKNRGGQTINNITYNTQIVINPFGQENISYINSDYISDLVENRPVESIPKLIEYIHFNPDFKENQNVKISNRKQPYAKIFNGKTWVLYDKKETIDSLISKGYTVIDDYYTGNHNNAISFKEEYEQGDSKLNKRIQKDTELMMLNCNNLN